LKFNDYEILQDFGKMSAEIARELAEGEYEKFRIEQDMRYQSDFDKSVKKYIEKKK